LQVPEESTRIAMVKHGEVDIVGVSNDNAIRLRDTEGYELRQTRASAHRSNGGCAARSAAASVTG